MRFIVSSTARPAIRHETRLGPEPHCNSNGTTIMRNTHVRTVVEPNLDLRLLRLHYPRGIGPGQECRSEGYELPNLTLRIGRMQAAHTRTRPLGIVLPGLRYHVHKPSPNLRNYGCKAQALPSSFWTSHSRIGPFSRRNLPCWSGLPYFFKVARLPD